MTGWLLLLALEGKLEGRMLNPKPACKEGSKHAKMGGGHQTKELLLKWSPARTNLACSRPVWPEHSRPGRIVRVLRVRYSRNPAGLRPVRIVDGKSSGKSWEDLCQEVR